MAFLSGLTNRFTSAAVAATAAAPPTAAQFQGWSSGAQAAYLSANSADDPPFLVIGDPGGAQILATLGFDGQTVRTAPVPRSYADAASSGNPPSSDDFARWDPELQLAYVRASGVTPPAALVLGDAAGPQTLAALNWNDTGIAATPVPASYRAAVAGTAPKAADVQGWPQQLQLAYLQANGTGSPPFLIVGDPGHAQVLATLGQDGASVVTSTVPQSYSALALAAANLKKDPTSPPVPTPSGATAQSWDPALQLSYLQSVSTDHPPFLILGDPTPGGKQTATTQTLVTLSADRKSLGKAPVPTSYSNAVSTGVPPAASDAGAWPAALKLSFLRTGSADVPPFLVAVDAPGKLSLLTLDDHGRMDRGAVPADYADAISGTGAPPAADFGTGAGAWPAALQLTYLRTLGAGTPPFAIVGPTSPTGFLLTPSADRRGVALAALPQSYAVATAAYAAAPSTMTTAAFGALTQAQQLAYLTANGTGAPPALVLDAKSLDAVLVTPSAADPTAVAVTPMASVLQGWAPQLQAAFVQAYGTATTLADGTSTPKSVVLGTGQNVYTATLDPGGSTASVAKGDVGSPGYWGTVTANVTASDAAALLVPPSVATFGSWTASQQAAYVAAQGAVSGSSILIGDAATGETQLLATVLPNGSVFSAPVPQSYADAVAKNTSPTPQAFEAWPDALQSAYVTANGAGSPASVTLGSGNDAITATLAATGTSLSTPSQNTSSASVDGYLYLQDQTLDAQTFLSLPSDSQIAILDKISSKYSLVSSYKSNSPQGKPYSQYQADIDFSNNIIDLMGDSPSAPGTVVSLPVAGQQISFKVPTSEFPGLDRKATITDRTGAATDFSAWPAPLQSYYVDRYGQSSGASYPKTIVVALKVDPNVADSPDSEVMTLLSSGDQALATPSPATNGFLSAFHGIDVFNNAIGTFTTAPEFASWPSACQQAFVAQAWALGPTTSGVIPMFDAATNSQSSGLTIRPTPNGATPATATGWALVADDTFLAKDPAAIDAGMLGALSQQQVSGYLAAKGTGVPPFIKFGSGATATIMASVATATGSFVSVVPVPPPTQQLPGGYLTKPADLAPADFLSWPAAVRQSYVTDNGTGTPRTVRFGPAGAPQVTASLSASGQLSVVTTPNALSTAGMADNTLPYLFLPGALGGVASTINQTVANSLFPVLNGDPTVAGSTLLTVDANGTAVARTPDQAALVAQYNTAPGSLDPAVFGGWNSAVQLQYMRAHAADFADGCLAIGSAGDASGVVHAFMSAPTVPQLVPQKVYVVENLQKIDIAKMPLVDQQALAGMPAFAPIAQSLNLIPDGVRTVAPGQTSGADANGKTLPTAQALVGAIFTTAAGQINDPALLTPAQPDGDMPAADRKVFSDELALLQQQLSTSAVYSPTDIQTQVDTVMTRFARANAFSVCVNVPGQRVPDIAIQTYPSVTIVQPQQNISNTTTIDKQTLLFTDPSVVGGTPVYETDSGGAKTYSSSPTSSASHYVGREMSLSDYVLANFTNPLPKVGGSIPVSSLPPGTMSLTGTQGSLNQTVYVPVTLQSPFTISFSAPDGTGTPPKPYPASLDNNASIRAGYNVFITQEQQILSLAQRAQSVATTGKLTNQALDGPDLVYMFQLFANLTGEAVVRVDTEEVNQTNALLQMYSALQQAVQTAVQACAADSDTTGKHTMSGPDIDLLKQLFGKNPVMPLSPIEILKGVKRPTNQNDNNGVSDWNLDSNAWNSYNQEISTAVSSINQDSQIKMNDINDETKQKDRNFDLANSALQKAQDVLSQINSVGAG